MLEISNLHATVADKPILKGISLTVPAGEVHAIMGPNGSGKSTLSYVLAGREEYEVTGGDIVMNGESIMDMPPEERAAKGVFLAFQYPVEIPGVQMTTFMKTAVNAVRKARGQPELDAIDFLKLMKGKARQITERPHLNVKAVKLLRPLTVDDRLI